MDPGVSSALWDLEAAFVAHPVRDVLENCAHCGGVVRLADADPTAVALALGDTLGTERDVRALTPWMLHKAATGDGLDLHTALSRVARSWSGWTVTERGAVRGFVDALWVALLDRHPGPDTDGVTAVAFLDGAGGLGEDPERLLAIWEYKDTASADHHLAELVVDAFYGARVDPATLAWAHAAPQRERLHRALGRDRDERWAGDLAAACELLPR